MEMFYMGLEVASLLVTAFVLAGLVLCRIEIKGVQKLYIALGSNILLLLVAIISEATAGEVDSVGIFKCMVGLQLPLIAGISFLLHSYICDKLENDTIMGLVYEWAPVAVYIVITLFWLISFRTGYLFQISTEGVLTKGRYSVIGIVFLYLFPVLDIVFMVLGYLKGKVEQSSLTLFCIFLFLPLIAQVFTIISGSIAALYISFSFSYLLVYIFHYRYEVKLLQAEIEEAVEQKTNLVISQLQPHFMLNSMTTVKYLCMEDPAYAQKAISKLSSYFKNTVEVLQYNQLVHISQEMANIQTYLWLEQLRFENLLRIKINYEEFDFEIPAFTLQPLVENAVKHAICKKEGGGTVSISIDEVEEEDQYRIAIQDDGVGFDTTILYDEKYATTGINNVKRRLQKMMHARLGVKSKIGYGTLVEIFIPR